VGHTGDVTDTPEQHAARDHLAHAGAAFKQARDKLADTTTEVRSAMVAALKAGLPQKDVIELSGYTRESVRSLARANGIEPR
jgi:hypothetical protein